MEMRCQHHALADLWEIPGTLWIGQPRSLSECYGGKKYLLLLPGINQNLCFPAHSPVNALTSPQTPSVCTLHFQEKNVHLQPLCKKYVSNLSFNIHPCSPTPRVVHTNSFCIQRWCPDGRIAASLNRFPNMESKNTSTKICHIMYN
jgi:hypothetical protein